MHVTNSHHNYFHSPLTRHLRTHYAPATIPEPSQTLSPDIRSAPTDLPPDATVVNEGEIASPCTIASHVTSKAEEYALPSFVKRGPYCVVLSSNPAHMPSPPLHCRCPHSLHHLIPCHSRLLAHETSPFGHQRFLLLLLFTVFDYWALAAPVLSNLPF